MRFVRLSLTKQYNSSLKLNLLLIFQKKTQEPVASSAVPMYKSPIIYRSDDYFQKE